MRNWKIILLFIGMGLSSAFAERMASLSSAPTTTRPMTTLTQEAVSRALGWQAAPINRCGGYYVEAPISYPANLVNTDKLLITSNEGLFSFHGTSVSEGKVTITRAGQQMSSNKAYLYRDPTTGKLSAIEMLGDVQLREPNQLVIGSHATYDLKTHSKKLDDILYRSTIYANGSPPPVSYQDQQTTRRIEQLSAWGQADNFSQTTPRIYDFSDASYSTCPPESQTWRVKAKKLELNKNTGRGYATHARLYLHGIPIFYTPYFNFPIDARRQTGFLSPRFGTSNRFGPYFSAPFYWNMAPNYDSTITPSYLSKRGLQITDLSRYLTPIHHGEITASILPNDRMFSAFQSGAQDFYGNNTNPTTQSELRQLENASTTRHAFSWVDQSQYNINWSSHINYNYVGDDYYLHDFSGNIAEVNNNELLQEAGINYASEHWDAGTRLQGYQTLNQLDEELKQQDNLPITPTVYSRFPQVTLNGNYPNEPWGLQYFIYNDATRFSIRPYPGNDTKLPIGTRTNIQPGISRPFSLPYFFITPRIQFAGTQYEIGLIDNTSKTPSRTIPILDISSGFFFDRDVKLMNYHFKQTLEPQVYYTYIPYKNQNNLPLFDTALNTLTYDQLFTYNRFSGLDRIGDANQVSLGVTTRFIDDVSGYEKASAAIGEIYYFKKREVTLYSPQSQIPLDDLQDDPNNLSIRSPISGVLRYNLTPSWNATANMIWNTKESRFDNQNITLQYSPEARKLFNIGYNFVRNTSDVLPWVPSTTPVNNLSQTTLSFSWPVSRDWELLGLWTENWNQKHLQNVLSGLQYDSCCWAVRFVAGRTFVGQNSTGGTYTYNNQVFLEFSLKGLGNIGPSGDSSTLLAGSIPGYHSNFGRNY